MNFLVTGGAGFIGSHVCERLLREGHSVRAFDDLNDFYDPALKRRNLDELTSMGGAFDFIRGDILDPAALETAFKRVRFDQVLHFAARAGVRPSLEAPALYQRVNVEGTVNVLEAARKNGVRKIILASSSSVYGVNAKIPFAENDPVSSAISPYAASKLACESLGHVYHHVHGMDVLALRFFTVYGPRQRPDLAIHKFATLIAAGRQVPVFGDGRTARDYTYVSDIVDGVTAATRREFGFQIINLGGSKPVQLWRLIELLETAMGRAGRIERKPLQPGDVPVTWADLSLAQRLLDYQPRVEIEDGIARFTGWFLDQKREQPQNFPGQCARSNSLAALEPPQQIAVP
jgi:UDP-glucuronate 4-epimerase